MTEANPDTKIFTGIVKTDNKARRAGVYEQADRIWRVIYYQPVAKDKPDAYLEGIRDGFRGYGLTAYLLKPAQAKLWRLMHQAGLPKEIKNKISYYMQDIPEETMKEMIQILEEKAGGYQGILQELVKKMELKR